MRTTPPAPRSQRCSARLGLTVGALAGSLVFGGGAAWAYWSAAATATGTASTTKVAITQASFPGLGKSYSNTLSSLKNTGSFTVTNAGAATGTVTVSLSGTGQLSGKLSVALWPVSSSATCDNSITPPTSNPTPGTGTWADADYDTPLSLAAGASQRFCVRTTAGAGATQADAQALQDASGSISASSTLTATIASAGWTATDSTGVASNTTEGIYPVSSVYVPASGQSTWFTLSTGASSSGRCADVNGGSSSSGAEMIAWSCTSNDNQSWQITPVAGTTPQLVTLRPMHATGTRLAVDASSNQVILTEASSSAQRWLVQERPGGDYQLVSPVDGRCLQLSASASANTLKTAECSNANSSVFLTRKPVTSTTPASPTQANAMTVSMAINAYNATVTFQYLSSGVWLTSKTISGGAALNFTVSRPSGLGNGASTSVRLVRGTSTSPATADILWTGTMTRAASGNGMSLTAGQG